MQCGFGYAWWLYGQQQARTSLKNQQEVGWFKFVDMKRSRLGSSGPSGFGTLGWLSYNYCKHMTVCCCMISSYVCSVIDELGYFFVFILHELAGL